VADPRPEPDASSNQELLLKRTILAAALAGIALVSFEARAQVSTIVKPVQFGVALGAAIPTSDLSNSFSTGFNATATLGLNPAMIPLGIRIDGAYNQFGAKGGGANIHFTSVTGNLVYKVPMATASPYAIGGAGWYNAAINITGLGSGSDNHFGWNLCGGLSMPLSGFDAFVEARYNRVIGNGGSLSFVPITFGIMF
jgi:Outer membrane protein beta-barrel domain